MELKQYSIGRIILLTFLILASPSCKNLFSNSLKKEIDENRYVQHLILLILIITLLTLFGNPLLDGDENTNNVIEYIKSINHKKTVILVTHDTNLINLSDDVLYLENGSSLFSGEVSEYIMWAGKKQ